MALRTSVRPYAGKPAIFVQDTPITGIMHWHRNMTLDDAKRFADSGINCFSFIGNIDLGQCSPTYEGNAFQLMTHEFLDRNIETILQGCPQALILPRFRLYASEAWMKQHPQAPSICYDLDAHTSAPSPMPSLAYEPWIQDALEALKNSVVYTEQTWGEHILGYHSGFGQSAEHVIFWEPKISDYNPAMIQFFRQWLAHKYASDQELRQAWNDDETAIQTASAPAPEIMALYNPQYYKAIWNPQEHQQIIDFLTCQADLMALRITQQATTVKNALKSIGAEKIYGVFYGYVNLPANTLSHYAIPHQALKTVLDCPDVDFIAAPLDYEARHPGGVSQPQVVPGSITLHNKIYYAEDDTGTHLSTYNCNLLPTTPEESIQVLIRNFCETWRSGGTQWYMDLLGIGIYHDPKLMEAIQNLVKFAERHAGDRTSTAQIAVFVSMESLNVSRTFNILTGSLLELQLHELAHIGAPFDFYCLEDLPLLAQKDMLKNIKMAVILNGHLISPEIRQAINQNLKSHDRTILWFHAPNVCQKNGFSPEAASEIMGINCVMGSNRLSLLTETFMEGSRTIFGISQPANPRLYAADKDAESLGYGVQGTYVPFRQGTDGTTFARKKLPGWTSVWSSAPVMPDKLLRIFAQEAGVHIFSNRGDQVQATNQWVSVHASVTAPLTLKLPKTQTVREALSGKIVAQNATQLQLKTTRGQTLLFELQED